MGIANIVKSRGFKNFMAKLYGIGASVVIIGALFKINHYPGADYMLIAGLGTEAIIFFFSAFEPPHVEPDWSLVYPELAGMYHGISDNIDDDTVSRSDTKGLSGELDNMLAEAKVGPELIESLGKGLNKLSESTSKLSDISDAAVVTNKFTEKVKTASENVENLSESYSKQAETINKEISASEEHLNSLKTASSSADGLSDVYSKASESLKSNLTATTEFDNSVKAAAESAKVLADNYTRSAEVLSKSAEALDFTNLKENDYSNQLNKISQNLASLNTTYEMQLQNSKAQTEYSEKLNEAINNFIANMNNSVSNTVKYQENLTALNTLFENQMKGTSDQVATTAKLKETLDAFLEKLNESANKTVKYNEELDNLANKVAALNTVYGNMLSAMNVKS